MATHYSVSDWDISSGWELDTGTYISPPSSIFIYGSSGATCKRSEVWNVPQGMIITYAKSNFEWGETSYDYGPLFGFRNQATSGAGLTSVGNVSVGYALLIKGNVRRASLYRDDSLITEYSLIAYPDHLNVWNKYKFTWWSDTGGAGLFVRLEYWNGTNWVKMVNDINDPTDKYKDSTVNRVSIASYYFTPTWFDDTEIWGP